MANTTISSETAVLESVIENAKETTEVTTKNLREMAQHGARKASEGYEQFSKATYEAGEQLTAQLAEARDGAAVKEQVGAREGVHDVVAEVVPGSGNVRGRDRGGRSGGLRMRGPLDRGEGERRRGGAECRRAPG